jgi:hypothetical protein
VRIASAAFVLLLLGAHVTDDFDDRLALPLSQFRDGEQAWLGYLLFTALVVASVMYTRDLIRAGKDEEALTAGLAASLLMIVAVTPSLQGFHILSSLLLLVLLFGHYWWLLRNSGSPWIIVHLSAPLALAWLSGYHSYGLWQKCLIVYLVALANVRQHLLGLAAASVAAASAPTSFGGVNKRRKVYRLEESKAWTRRKAR